MSKGRCSISPARRSARFLTIAVVPITLMLIAAACGGIRTTERISEGAACSVVYHSGADGSSLVLINESHERPEGRQSPPVSQVPDRVMEVLVTDFENLGFFANSVPVVPSSRAYIAISIRDKTHVLPKGKLTQEWSSMVRGIHEVWNRGDKTVLEVSRGRGRDMHAERRALEERKRRTLEKYGIQSDRK